MNANKDDRWFSFSGFSLVEGHRIKKARMSFPPPSEKQARVLWLSVTALSISVFLALIGLLLWGVGWVIGKLSAVLLPLAIAGVVAYLLDPVVDFFEKKRIPRTGSILLVFFIAILIVLGLLGTVVPKLIIQTGNLVEDIPDYSRRMHQKLNHFLEEQSIEFRIPWIFTEKEGASGGGPEEGIAAGQTNESPTNAVAGANQEEAVQTNGISEATAPDAARSPPADSRESGNGIQWDSEFTQKLISWVTAALPKIGSWIAEQASHVASWAGLVVGLALVPVYSFYFLQEKKGIQKHWSAYLPLQESKAKDEVVFVLREINNCLITFFRGQVLVAACVGILLAIGFSLVGLNYALLLGVLAGILSIVPYLGVMLSIIPAVTLAIVQFGDWLHPILVLVVFVLVQMAEGLVISPKIMGDRVGLHPLTIIIAVMIGTALMGGILGGVLAIPLTAALRTLMFRYVWKKRREV